jgi:phage FluMu gp28-like protein
MVAEYAAQEWPGLIHQVMISARWYAENFPRLKGRMEDVTTTIAADPLILEDFRVVGLKAGVPQVLERTGEQKSKRHGDGAIAKLMVIFAALEDPGSIQVVATARTDRPRSPVRAMLDRFRGRI